MSEEADRVRAADCVYLKMQMGCPPLQIYTALFATYKGRDRVLRALQYGSKAGAAAITNVLDSNMRVALPLLTSLHRLRSFLESVTKRTMSDRRGFRLFSGLAILNELNMLHFYGTECPWGEGHRRLYDLVKVLMCVFFSGDLVRWMQNSKLLRGNQELSRNISFGSFSIACLLQAAYWGRRSIDGSEPVDKQLRAKRNFLQFTMNTITFAHVSRLYQTSNFLCGITGMLSSLMDLQSLIATRTKAQVKHSAQVGK